MIGFVVPEFYNITVGSGDVALIITEEPIEFGPKVKPIKLPVDEDEGSLYGAGKTVTVAGSAILLYFGM